ncbi:hypothetical protein NCCNTM_26130 [Mycolicibacterium sp. NCC-Tsukiji]|nr:hypothetical protein NCCNTM_26130 [Mycolicibacterium sp. NCC-Tsukiji]
MLTAGATKALQSCEFTDEVVGKPLPDLGPERLDLYHPYRLTYQALALLEGVPMSGSDGTQQPGRQTPPQTYTKEHLANFKTPRSVAFLDTLPRDPGGKVVKPQLREMNR